ncbi:Protein CBG27654 [Caenorhabditis briggsae]|uniref:Protein CBG27654 n=1 Tax=Caenorhabditis briggsae TaxID=6238 RepID=B6IJ99_CAEBR|nr:Protein CBG27654 [Caenorhabditis briggsae]CAR99933.1 Protein CBG27654 [Caenorhabditis briggsae]
MDNKNQPAQVSSTQKKVRFANDVQLTDVEIRKNVNKLIDKHEKETYEIRCAHETIHEMVKTGAAPSNFMNIAKVLLDGTPYACAKEVLKLHIAATQGGNKDQFVFESLCVLDYGLRRRRKFINEIRQTLSDQLEGSDNRQFLALEAKGATEDLVSELFRENRSNNFAFQIQVAVERIEEEFKCGSCPDPWTKMVKVIEDHEDGNTTSYPVSPLAKKSSD